MTAVAQSGICAEARPYASFIAFDWCDGVDVPAARRALAQVPLLTQTLAAEYPQAGLCSVVAIGINHPLGMVLVAILNPLEKL